MDVKRWIRRDKEEKLNSLPESGARGARESGGVKGTGGETAECGPPEIKN